MYVLVCKYAFACINCVDISFGTVMGKMPGGGEVTVSDVHTTTFNKY